MVGRESGVSVTKTNIVSRMCAECHGTGRIKCPTCDGVGTIDRRRIEDGSIITTPIPCPSCRSIGTELCVPCVKTAWEDLKRTIVNTDKDRYTYNEKRARILHEMIRDTSPFFLCRMIRDPWFWEWLKHVGWLYCDTLNYGCEEKCQERMCLVNKHITVASRAASDAWCQWMESHNLPKSIVRKRGHWNSE